MHYSQATYQCTVLLFVHQNTHRKEGKVPEFFPGVLKISINLKAKLLLNKEYRDICANRNPESEYFVKYFLLLEISAKRKKDGCCRNTLSQASTPTNKAFGLMVLNNKLHVWNH